MAEAVPFTKNVLCRYFKFGTCRNEANCPYSHDREAMKPIPCKYFQRGTCALGNKCRFDHVRPGAVTKKPEDARSASASSGSKPSGHAAKSKGPRGESFTILSKEPSHPRPSLYGGKSWADAPEFVPGVIRGLNDGRSYAQAAGSTSSSSSTSGYASASGAGEDGEYKIDPYEELCPFAMAGECRYGTACAYIHGDVCELCGVACLHPYSSAQRKSHHEECMKLHEEDMNHSFKMANSLDKACSICYDTIFEKSNQGERRFGILPACNHVFCLSCIRKWRQQKENVIVPTKTARACPACRVPSDFVIPSKIWVEDKEEKAALIQDYKDNMRKKHCKYFAHGDKECPFGNKCFYRHETRDGKKVDVGPPKRRVRQNADGDAELFQQMLMWDFIDSAELRNSFMLEMDLFSMDSDEESDNDEGYFWDNGSDYMDDELGFFDYE